MPLTTFQPGHDLPCLEQLRVDYGTEDESSTYVVRNITLVGACYSDSWLSKNDLDWLKCALEFCQRQKIPVSKNFRLTPLNISMLNGQEVDYNEEDDFLKQTIPTDLLVIGYVPAVRSRPDEQGYIHPAYRLSPHHYETNAWENATLRDGATIVVTFETARSPCEITARCFESDQYEMSEQRQIKFEDQPNYSFNMETLIHRKLIPIIAGEGISKPSL